MTDEHEHAMNVAEQAYSAGNLVTCDGYYEFDLDAAAAVIAADRAGLVAEVERLVRAWEAQHKEKVKEREEARLWFEKAQKWAEENARLREALEVCAAELYAPDPACSCHILPPCRDCTDYGSIREAIAVARTALGASHD